MGISFGTLTKIFLGIGLGILATSCLTITILFGQYADKGFTNLEKQIAKIEKNKYKQTLDTSIAIAVLGCISAAAALGAITLSIILEGKTLILIIVSGASALFAFGCIVAEGIFTKIQIDGYMIINHYRFGNQDSDPFEDPDSGAQEYIRNAIMDLYDHAHTIIQNSHKGTNIPDWNNVSSFLGYSLENDPNHIITYSDIWKGYIYYSDENNYNNNYIVLKCKDYGCKYIVAKYSDFDEVKIASTKFSYKGKITRKERFCWYKDDYKDFSCKNFEVDKIDNYSAVVYSNYFQLEEYIIPPKKYYSKIEAEENDLKVNYLVSMFPSAYKKVDPKDIEEIDPYDNEYFGFENSDNEHKINGKTLAKANFKDIKKEYENPNKFYNLRLVPKEPKNSNDVRSMCNEDEDGYSKCSSLSYSEILSTLKLYDKESNKGKIPSSFKKYARGLSRSFLNDIPKESSANYSLLYTAALINMILQIFGILFWACGQFLGLILHGGSDEKTPSEGEV